MDGAIWTAGASELADAVRGRDVKAVELLDLHLERIGRHDRELNSFVVLDPDGARSAAEEVDRRIAAGEDPGPLAGVPVGVKDLEDAAGLPTGRGSLLFPDAVAAADSTQVARMRRAGAVILGKTTTPEMGSLNFTSNRATGVTRNPWNLERTPGGSSGGSAAAVAAGLVPLATGSDGGGSIRIPASFCGLPGLKPTFGFLPRGPHPLWSSNVSVQGPMARTVRDVARYLDQVAGTHPMDPFSLPVQASLEASLGLPLEGLRAVWSPTLGFGVCEPEVEALARAAAERLIEAAGMREVDVAVELSDPAMAWAATEAIDVFTELERFWPERADDMTPVVAITLQLAGGLRATQLAEAARARYEVLRQVNEVFEGADLILTPTTPTVAFGADGPLPYEVANKPLDHPILAVCFTYPFNLTGHPAMSVPAGFDAAGMPVGLQIVGPRLSEARLLSAARVLEQVDPWPGVAPAYR